MKTTLLFKASFVALLFAACNSEEENPATVTERTLKSDNESEFYAYREAALEEMTQTFYFDANTSEEVTLTSAKGVDIKFKPQNLTVNGKRVKGKVKVEFIELTSRGEMALTAMPTQAEAGPLFSGGEFFIEMTVEGGQTVDEGSPYTLEVPTALTQGEGEQLPGSGPDGMTVWEGNEDENGNVIWEEETGENGEVIEIPVVEGEYIVELISFEWCNIDVLEKLWDKRTDVTVDVPDGYDFNNTRVYFVYTGAVNLCVQLNYDPVTGNFDHTNLPLGISGTIIMWSPGQPVVATMPITIAGSDFVTITSGDLVTTTNAQLIALLNGLPQLLISSV